MPGRYDHIDFKPPQGAQEAARRALEIRQSKPESQRGMTPVGIARARDLSNGKRLSPETVRRMLAFFQRHEVDKQSDSWDAQGPSFQAWGGWGGDAGFAWARKVVRQMEAADAAGKRMSDDAVADGDHGVAVVVPIDEETAEYALPGVDGAHVTLAYLGRRSTLAPGSAEIARSVVSRWASQTPAMPARFSGVGRFAGAEGEPDAVYLSVDAPGLTAARDALCRALREAGLPVASNHGFTAHATLAYVPREAATPAAPVDLPLAFAVDCAAVWCGADRDAPCSFTGVGDPTTMTDDNAPANDDADSLRCPEATPIAFADGAVPSVGHSTWNQIARIGEWAGHPQGAVRFTPQVFAEIVRNFAAHGNREIPLDYEHSSERLPDNVATHGVPAPGWVTRLEVRNGGSELWALFKWVSADAVRYVRTGQYRYVSPAVNFRARDKASGKPAGAKLTSVALTNHPFLEGMQPLAADDRNPALDALIAQVAGMLGVSAGDVRSKLVPQVAPHTAEGATMAPHADTVHTPTTGASPTMETPKMDPEQPAAPSPGAPAAQPEERPSTIPPPPSDAAMADLPKMAPAAAPSNIAPEDAAKAKAEKDAASPDDTKRDALGKFATMQRFAEACGMADFSPDADGAEDALMAYAATMRASLAAFEDAKRAAMSAAAATMAQRVVAAGLADAAAVETLTTMALSQRETFDVLFPVARIEAAEKAAAEAAVKMSERAAPAVPPPDAVALLTARLTPAGTTHATANSATTPAAEMTFSQRRDALAATIAKRDGIDFIAATVRADNELRAAH